MTNFSVSRQHRKISKPIVKLKAIALRQESDRQIPLRTAVSIAPLIGAGVAAGKGRGAGVVGNGNRTEEQQDEGKACDR
ncbi:MAG: hypothetical protein AAGA60_27590 [Cyanobacteria bacterium P01_E01_bin.42]